MYEVDFWQVSISEKSGDAITARFTRSSGSQAVLVIDAGFTDFGSTVVEQVRNRYQTNRVDLVVSTHPDQDHIEGLAYVLENLAVEELWVHIPSAHGFTQEEVAGRHAEELVRIATRRGTRVREPFAGIVAIDNLVTVAGPTESFYEEQLHEQAAAMPRVRHHIARAAGAIRRALRPVPTAPDETLTDDQGGTSPRNNSSVILNVALDAQRMLFTGDAGVPALNEALDFADLYGLNATPLGFLDVPHHGSHHNVDPSTMDRLLASAAAAGHVVTAFISSSPRDEDHPSPKVLNALKRRGCQVFTTEGGNILHGSSDAPPRDDYHSIDPMPWVDESNGL